MHKEADQIKLEKDRNDAKAMDPIVSFYKTHKEGKFNALLDLKTRGNKYDEQKEKKNKKLVCLDNKDFNFVGYLRRCLNPGKQKNGKECLKKEKEKDERKVLDDIDHISISKNKKKSETSSNKNIEKIQMTVIKDTFSGNFSEIINAENTKTQINHIFLKPQHYKSPLKKYLSPKIDQFQQKKLQI